MTTRRPRGRRPDQPLVDLASVFADDELLDSLAAGHGSTGLGAAGDHDPLPELFTSWRSEMAARPLPAPPSTKAAAAALSAVVDPRPARALRPVLAASVAIVALLLGSAVLFTRTATEHSPLWGIASVIWQDRAASVDARNQAFDALREARQALEAGSPDLAEVKLQEAKDKLGLVNPVDNKAVVEELWESVNGQSENGKQALASSSAESRRSSTPSTTTGSPRGTARSTPPVVQVPSQAQAASTPAAQPPTPGPEPTPAPVQVVPARVAPPVTVDPFLSMVEPTSSAEVVTPPLLPPAEPPVVTSEPVPAVTTDPPAPVDTTSEVPTGPVEPDPGPPPVDVTTTPDAPTTTETTSTPAVDGEVPGDDGQDEQQVIGRTSTTRSTPTVTATTTETTSTTGTDRP